MILIVKSMKIFLTFFNVLFATDPHRQPLFSAFVRVLLCGSVANKKQDYFVRTEIVR